MKKKNETMGYDKKTKTYGWYLSDIKPMENSLKHIEWVAKDLFYPNKILNDLIISLEYFLPQVGPGSDYDVALNDFLEKRKLAYPKSVIKQLSMKIGFEPKVNYREEKKIFYKELEKVEKRGHPASLNNTLEDWYKTSFCEAYPLYVTDTVLDSLGLDRKYCRDFYCPQLDCTVPIVDGVGHDEKYMTYDQEQIDTSYKQIEIYKKKISSGEYTKELKQNLNKAKVMLELWIKKIKENNPAKN